MTEIVIAAAVIALQATLLLSCTSLLRCLLARTDNPLLAGLVATTGLVGYPLLAAWCLLRWRERKPALLFLATYVSALLLDRVLWPPWP